MYYFHKMIEHLMNANLVEPETELATKAGKGWKKVNLHKQSAFQRHIFHFWDAVLSKRTEWKELFRVFLAFTNAGSQFEKQRKQ